MVRTSWYRALILVMAVVAFVTISAMRSNAETITVAGGTPLPVHVVGSLSSATASAGQTFQIAAAEPLTVQGVVVVNQGAVGEGHVVAATIASKHGKPGSISVQLDWIYAVDGQQLPLTATARTLAGANKTGTANIATAAATLVFGPVGLFAHNFVKGKDVVVNADFVFPAYVASDRAVTVVNGRY